MNSNQADELASRLISRTKEGKVKWDANNASSQMFTTLVAGKLLSIYHTGLLCTLRIHDQDGNVIDSFMPSLSNKTLYNNLFEIAKQNALGTDVALDDIMRALSD